MSPWSRFDGNQRMFLLRDRPAGMVMIPMPSSRCFFFATGGLHRPPVILANFAWICTETTLRYPRRTLGSHENVMVFGDDDRVMPIYPNKKIIQSCSKVLPGSEVKNQTMKTQRTIFPIIQSTGKYHLATCNPRKSAWILPLGFHSKLELGLKGRVAFFLKLAVVHSSILSILSR